MKSTLDVYTWHENLYFRWTALPVLAHLLSWMTGMGGIVLFPILITVAQYLILNVHPSVSKPGYWFFTLPLTFFVWMKWGPFPGNQTGDSVLSGVNGYYLGQLLITLFLPLILKKGRASFLLNWLLSMALAWVIWIMLYKLTGIGLSVDRPGDTSSFAVKVYLIYPIIALIANAVSGFVLTSNRLIIANKTD